MAFTCLQFFLQFFFKIIYFEHGGEWKRPSKLLTFSGRPTVVKGRIIYQICFESTSKKHPHRNQFEKITNLEKFENFAQKCQDYDHKCNKALYFNNFTNSMYISCVRETFLKEDFQIPPSPTSKKKKKKPDEPCHSQIAPVSPEPNSLRKSSRK